MTRPLPVTFILEELNFGGTQKQTLELARRLDRARFAPRIWTMWPGEELLAVAQDADIPVTALTPDAHLRPLNAIAALWRQLRRERPPLLHLCTSFPNVWGRLLGKLTGVPAVVASCRGQGNVAGQHERFLWRLAEAHVCNARSIRQELLALGAPEDRVFFVPNGVDTEFFCPAPAPVTAPEIVCVGRLVPEKDHTSLLAALALVRQSLPAVRLHVVGDGPLLAQTQALAHDLGLGEAVVFHGSSARVREHLHQARLVVLASVSEGMPNVLLEGMACALPVVGTRVGGIPDLVEHGRQGLLVPPRAPEALAAALTQVLQEADLAAALGQAGRAMVLEHYSLQSMTRQHESVYASVCRRAGL